MERLPLVSIIMPTYNRRQVIGGAIDSCLSQTYKNIEVIICDDHSSDGTKEYIIDRMSEDNRIKFCENPEEKKGANAARNTAIKMAKGKYLAFLDSDDYLLDDSIEVRINAFMENPKVAMVYGNAFCESGNKRIKWVYTDIKREKLDQKKYLMQELSLCQQNTIMLRTAVFSKIGLLDEEQKGWTDDGVAVAVGMRYPIQHSRKFVAVVRKSEESMTSNKWNMYLGCKIMINRYKKQIIQYASFWRYLLWKIRLFSLYCYAKENELPLESGTRLFWERLHSFTRNMIWPYFKNHFE